MQTRRQIAMMNALNGEQEAILNAFRNLPVHSGVLTANYQKAAEVENGQKRERRAADLDSIRTEIAVRINNLYSDMNHMKKDLIIKIEDHNRDTVLQLEKDVRDLKTQNPFLWSEFLTLVVLIIALWAMTLYKPPQMLMIGN